MSIIRTRPPIGIPKSKRGLVRMEQFVFKKIVEMAYEMEFAAYFKNILDIHRIIHNNLYVTDRCSLCNRCHNNRFHNKRHRSVEYIPTKNMLDNIYKYFTIIEVKGTPFSEAYLISKRFYYKITLISTFEPNSTEEAQKILLIYYDEMFKLMQIYYDDEMFKC
jgi:hypothetical protein